MRLGSGATAPNAGRPADAPDRAARRVGLAARLVGALGIVALAQTASPRELSPHSAVEPPVVVARSVPDQAEPLAIVGSPATTFLIESIVVEGGRRGSQAIVVAETLLTPGSSYTESQLQRGLQRVARLPFVVQADFSLRRGSERGRFELVIALTEAKPLFFGVESDTFFQQGVCCRRGAWDQSLSGPGLGARVFFGGHSELRGGLAGFGNSSKAGSYALANVGYTYHDLFGRHLAGTVTVGTDRYAHTVGAQLALPIDRANVLTLTADRVGRRMFSLANLSSPTARLSSLRVGLVWQRDTTDDPFVPRSGSRIGAAITYADSDFNGTSDWFPDPADFTSRVDVPTTGQERALLGSLQASRYWPLSRRLSFGLEARLAGSAATADGTITLDGVSRAVKPNDRGVAGSLGAVLTGALPERRAGLTQFSWTLGATFSDRARWRSCDPPVACEVLPRLADLASGRDREDVYDGWGDVRSRHGTLSASISARGRWGVVSLTFHYRHHFVDRVEWFGDHLGRR